MSFIPYQIDHKVIGAGKTLGISKKRITFKFGFANRDALSEGLTGAACRGSEHEVVLVLSLASGKRHVLLDGREVHFSQAEKMSNRGFDFPFSIRIPSVGAVQARLLTDSQPGSQPYNFYINGMSYFHFSKIYELGTPTMRVGQLTEQRSYASQFTSNSELEAPPEERRLIAQAKLESMRELREKQEREAATAAPKQMNHEEGNLINFDDDDVGAPPPVVPQQGGMMYHASSLTMDPALQQSQTFPPQQSFPPSSGPAYQNYSLNTSAPPPPQQQYGYGSPAQTTSATSQYSQQNASMLTQYSQPAPNPYAAPSPYAPPQQGSFSSQPSQQSYGYQQQSYPTQSAPAPTYEETQMAFGSSAPQQQQQQQQPDFASPQSYGSAPAFAQPPSASGSRAPPNQQYGYPPTNTGW
jgi:hypothetical protein